jgi:hypothetical protein
MDIQSITLNGEGIPFGVDLYTDRFCNASKVFAVSAEKDICSLRIVKNDLFDRSLSESRVYGLLFFQILIHPGAPTLVFTVQGLPYKEWQKSAT